MARSSKTQYVILGMLSMHAMSGYEIKQAIADSTAHFWSESDGQIYPTLNKLTEEGMVDCQEDYVGQRLRKVYSLNKVGEQSLNKWLISDIEPSTVRHELLLKLFFGRKAQKKVLIDHLTQFQTTCEYKLILFEQIVKRLREEKANSPDLDYWLITLNYGRQITKAQLNWCIQTINQFTTEELR